MLEIIFDGPLIWLGEEDEEYPYAFKDHFE